MNFILVQRNRWRIDNIYYHFKTVSTLPDKRETIYFVNSDRVFFKCSRVISCKLTLAQDPSTEIPTFVERPEVEIMEILTFFQSWKT